jgi:hypothetical protein
MRRLILYILVGFLNIKTQMIEVIKLWLTRRIRKKTKK